RRSLQLEHLRDQRTAAVDPHASRAGPAGAAHGAARSLRPRSTFFSIQLPRRRPSSREREDIRPRLRLDSEPPPVYLRTYTNVPNAYTTYRFCSVDDAFRGRPRT